jgi:hypothetical protein
MKSRLGLLAVVALLPGCADYLNNRDTVTLGAGNAVAANRAIHEVKPWNPDSRVTGIASNGDRVLAAQGLLLLPPGAVPPPGTTIVSSGVMPPAE